MSEGFYSQFLKKAGEFQSPLNNTIGDLPGVRLAGCFMLTVIMAHLSVSSGDDRLDIH